MSIAVVVLSSGPIFAQTGSPEGAAGPDRHDMRQNRQDLRGDRRDLRQDTRDIRADRQDMRQDEGAVRHDRQQMRQDAHAGASAGQLQQDR